MTVYKMQWLIIIAALLITGCAPASQPFSPLPPPMPSDIIVRHIYIPLLFFPVAATPVPSCYATTHAREFVRLMISDSRQERTVLVCSPALIRAAQLRGESLARLGYWSHCDPSGVCPNAVARSAGCTLPIEYAINGNNIESLIAGTSDVVVAWRVLSGSPKHADHLLGQNGFFRAQDSVGVAYVDDPGSKYSFYWVILIAKCN
ncbi:MAG TPA: hypothetical protein VLA24_09215 [Pseudomonadales bacterium]|nr:hypothetical protein [Pseudomonadales bacterium]